MSTNHGGACAATPEGYDPNCKDCLTETLAKSNELLEVFLDAFNSMWGLLVFIQRFGVHANVMDDLVKLVAKHMFPDLTPEEAMKRSLAFYENVLTEEGVS